MSPDPDDIEERLRRFDEWERSFTDPLRIIDPEDTSPASDSWLTHLEDNPPDSPSLEVWLAKRERVFPAWAAQYGPAGRWDFSAASIDPLVAVVFEVTPTGELLLSGDQTDFADSVTWYWGEVLRRARPARWQYMPGERDGHSPFLGHRWVQQLDTTGSYTPLLNLVRMLKLGDRRLLGELFEQWTSW